jgi:hypothetical protein
MTVLVAALLAAASISLGLRATSLFVDDRVHPMDRLALATIAGALITAVILQVFASYRLSEFAVGMLLSLSPVGPFDLIKWWFRSRGRRSPWLIGASVPWWVVALRWAFLAFVAAAIVAIAGASIRR